MTNLRRKADQFSKLVHLHLHVAIGLISLLCFVFPRSGATRLAENQSAPEVLIQHSSVTPPLSLAQSGAVEMELLTLQPSGFEPAEITRPAGRFLLAVNNRTGQPELSLELVSNAGRTVRTILISRETNFRQVLSLPTGSYTLRETSHRNWVCGITITQ